MKCNAQHLCPRCLVLKGDVPEIGSHLDILRRSTNARHYPASMIELAHRGLFEKGWSISYKGKHDVLKAGSWAPTLVRLAHSAVRIFAGFHPRRTHTILSSVLTLLRSWRLTSCMTLSSASKNRCSYTTSGFLMQRVRARLRNLMPGWPSLIVLT